MAFSFSSEFRRENVKKKLRKEIYFFHICTKRHFLPPLPSKTLDFVTVSDTQTGCRQQSDVTPPQGCRLEERHKLTERGQLFTNFANSCVSLGGVFALSSELFRRTNRRPTFAASVARLFIKQTRRHGGAIVTFDSSKRKVKPYVHVACFGGENPATVALRHTSRVVSSII